MLSLYLYGKKYPKFKITKDIPIESFIGTYIQLVSTPNWFQNTPYATATYTIKNTLKNIEWTYKDNKLQPKNSIDGRFTRTDVGTFKIKFKYVPFKGLYRILDYEINDFGTFLFVSSYTPKISWILWKPPEKTYDFDKAYEYGIEKKKLIEEFGVKNIVVGKKEVISEIVKELPNIATKSS